MYVGHLSALDTAVWFCCFDVLCEWTQFHVDEVCEMTLKSLGTYIGVVF